MRIFKYEGRGFNLKTLKDEDFIRANPKDVQLMAFSQFCKKPVKGIWNFLLQNVTQSIHK